MIDRAGLEFNDRASGSDRRPYEPIVVNTYLISSNAASNMTNVREFIATLTGKFAEYDDVAGDPGNIFDQESTKLKVSQC